jgi:glycosyltransferase involved in cell wall biosynthesis/SAM-dependent methyltransferase
VKEFLALQPKVSIVIPVYNGADYLDQAIQSALDQSYRNTEIIVVNDGSNDAGATEAVARRYGTAIRYIQKENGGVASALNGAIREMTGDYFSWLSHDDLYSREKIEKQIMALADMNASERGHAIIYSDYAVFSSTLETAVSVHLQGVPPEGFRYWLTIRNSLHGCTLLIPKNALTELGGFNETLRTTQDFDLWFRMSGRFRFHHIRHTLVYARSHADQGSIRLAATALAESNDLLIRFTNELTQKDLLSSGRRSAVEAYAEIAKSLWQRDFVHAAKFASAMALRSRKGASATTQLSALTSLVRGPLELQFWRLLRRTLSPQVRARLRRYFAPSRVANVNENLEKANLKKRFSQIYRDNIFGGRKSRSGEGSDLVQTAIIRRELPLLLQKIGAQSFLDAPCGDWHWMQKTPLGISHYIGVDIVDEMIYENRKKFASETTTFECLNLTSDSLPAVDVIFSRDCLVHLSFADAMRILGNFKRSGSRYLLTTTFSERTTNSDLAGKDSFWRPLNMQAEPFLFPAPLALINEGCTEERGKFKDKCLGLWELADIEINAYNSRK